MSSQNSASNQRNVNNSRAKRRGPRGPRGSKRQAFRPFTVEELEQRRASVPSITYPETLPVSARREDIARAITNNQVTIIAGETGSGKTTQLPKICLELGRGITGMIGHTQPRRIAARSVAERIASELGQKVGLTIGYQVRFTEEVTRQTLVKLMTDGILLAEIQTDPQLSRYDTLIIDEAHERSLNIDFLLGYIARLLPRRPDLKVIITSATIDTERFAQHFGSHTAIGAGSAKSYAPAPIIEVSGRTYPVEIRYRPLDDDIYDGADPESTDDVADEIRDSEPDVRGDFDGYTHRRNKNSLEQHTQGSARERHHTQHAQNSRTKGSAGLAQHSRTKGSAGLAQPKTPGRASAHDQVTGILLAADELMSQGEGDILVFLSGEGEIRDTQKAFEDELGSRYIAPGGTSSVPGAVEVLPLFSRLSAAEQHRIFTPGKYRRIILATNVAETSLTVPGIRYVIDPGTARISRYSNKTKVQRLPIEPISQASANQRSGRCGRVANGITIRLYSEEDFEARPEFTQPEIQRTSLASVILQMLALGLGKVEDFPFIDPPEARAVRAGAQLLEEIGAIRTNRHGESRLTHIGKQLARLPIDPRLGRMLIEANNLACASEVLVLVAALSVQDVRERPEEMRVQADQLHARFNAASSDFLAYLTLWRYLRTQQRELSGSAFRRMCRAEFLNYLRFREWVDVVRQLEEMARPLGLNTRPLTLPSRADIRAVEEGKSPQRAPEERNYPQHAVEENGHRNGDDRTPGETSNRAYPTSTFSSRNTFSSRAVAKACRDMGRGSNTPEAGSIHRSLLVGLLSNIGNYTERTRDYTGTRNTHFVIWPGSGLHRRTPDWVMAAELVETSRLFARTVALIQPEWIEPLAKNLTRTTYTEPYWSSRNGAAMCKEKVTLYGLTLVADRPVLLARTGSDASRELARDMFIRHALVEGQWRTHHEFLKRNREALEEATETENKLRVRGLVADSDSLATFYDERIPDGIVSGRHFDNWWKKQRHKTPDLLDFTQEFLLGDAHAREGDFPEVWRQGDLEFPMSYSFSPGHYGDGITIDIPVSVLPQVHNIGFDWLVPGMREELVIGTIRALPKRIRRGLVPAPDAAADILKALPFPAVGEQVSSQGAEETLSFEEAFTRAALKVRGVDIDKDAWKECELPTHLCVNFRIVSERGAVLEESTSLEHLQIKLATHSKKAVEEVVETAVSRALDEARRQLQQEAFANSRKHYANGSRGHQPKATQGAPATPDAPTAPTAPTAPDAPNTPANANTAAEPATVPPHASTALTTWPATDGGVLPAVVDMDGPLGMTVRAYPALRERKQKVYLDACADPGEQVRTHRLGVIQLLTNALALPEARVTSRWGGDLSLALVATPYPATSALVADLQWAAARNLADRWGADNQCAPEEMRSAREFGELVAWARDEFEDEIFLIAQAVGEANTARGHVDHLIRENSSVALLATVSDERAHMNALMPDGFIRTTPHERLWDLPRYAKAIMMRIEKAQVNPSADDALAWQVASIQEQVASAQKTAEYSVFDPATARVVEQARWMVEELRVSLFAQQLGTKGKVSVKRIEKLLATIQA